MDDEVMTLGRLLLAIKHYIEREAIDHNKGNELSLYGITTDDALGKVLEIKGGQIKIAVNSVPKVLEESIRSVYRGETIKLPKWSEDSGPYPNSKVIGG